MQSVKDRIAIINSWESSEYFPKSLLNIPENIELLKQYRYPATGRTIEQEVSMEALVSAVNSLRDQLYFATKGDGTNTPTQTPQKRGSMADRLMDSGTRPSGRMSAADKAEESARIDRNTQALRDDINKKQRILAYRAAVLNAQCEQVIQNGRVNHAATANRRAELLAAVNAVFSDLSPAERGQ